MICFLLGLRLFFLCLRDLSEKALSGVQCTNPYVRLSLRGENSAKQNNNQHHRAHENNHDIFKDSCVVQLKQDETKEKDIRVKSCSEFVLPCSCSYTLTFVFITVNALQIKVSPLSILKLLLKWHSSTKHVLLQ